MIDAPPRPLLAPQGVRVRCVPALADAAALANAGQAAELLPAAALPAAGAGREPPVSWRPPHHAAAHGVGPTATRARQTRASG